VATQRFLKTQSLKQIIASSIDAAMQPGVRTLGSPPQ